MKKKEKKKTVKIDKSRVKMGNVYYSYSSFDNSITSMRYFEKNNKLFIYLSKNKSRMKGIENKIKKRAKINNIKTPILTFIVK